MGAQEKVWGVEGLNAESTGSESESAGVQSPPSDPSTLQDGKSLP